MFGVAKENFMGAGGGADRKEVGFVERKIFVYGWTDYLNQVSFVQYLDLLFILLQINSICLGGGAD